MKCAAALLFALGLVALPVSATLTLTLAPAAQNAARGTELVFTGTLNTARSNGFTVSEDFSGVNDSIGPVASRVTSTVRSLSVRFITVNEAVNESPS